MKKSKIIPVILISTVLLGVGAALMLIRPWATSVEVRMTGTLLQGGKVVEEPVYVTVQGTILNDKEVDFRFLQSGIEDWLFTQPTDSSSRMDQRYGTPYIISSCGYYNVSENRMATAYYAFSAEEQMLLVYIMDDSQPVIACSANGEKSLEEIEEYFSVFVNVFSSKNETPAGDTQDDSQETEPLTESDSLAYPWMMPEVDHLDYEEFFAYDRAYHGQDMPWSDYTSALNGMWFVRSDDSSTAYEWESDENGIFICRLRKEEDPLHRIPNTADLVDCTQAISNTRQLYCAVDGKLLCVDVLTGERNTLYTAEYIPDLMLCHNDVLYFLAISDGILSLNRLYVPTMTLDLLYAQVAPEVPESCYNLYAPNSSQSVIIWETINPTFWKTVEEIMAGPESEYPELNYPAALTVEYITAHPFGYEDVQNNFAMIQNAIGLRPRMRGYYDPVADTYDEKYGIYDICFFGTGIHSDEEHFESYQEYNK